jgi:hypothetical protein
MTDATTPESTTDPGAVQAQLATMKREIDALQITVAESTRPWWKQASILIAALALLFSFGTTYYSAEQTRKPTSTTPRSTSTPNTPTTPRRCLSPAV